MPRCVAELRDVAPARHVQHAPKRLTRHREDDVASRHPRDLGERALGVVDVLEDLDGEHEVDGRGGERQCVSRREQPGESARAPVRGEPRVGQIEDRHRRVGPPLVDDAADDLALTRADLENAGGRVGARRERAFERAEEVRHDPALDRVRCAVLVVRVARRYGRRAHSAAGSTSSCGFASRTTRSARRPIAKTWNAAKSTISVFAVTWKSRACQSYSTLPIPTALNTSPTGRNTLSGL